MHFSCYAKGGVIDSFQPSFSHDEVVAKIAKNVNPDNPEGCGMEKKDCTEDSVNEAIEQIREVVNKFEHENPEKISFFSVPNFDYQRMDLYAVAKTGNDGSTFVFGNDTRIIRALASEASEIIYLS